MPSVLSWPSTGSPARIRCGYRPCSIACCAWNPRLAPATAQRRWCTPVHCAAPCPVHVKQAMIDWWGPVLDEYYSGTEGIGSTAITSREWLTHKGSVGSATDGILHILDDTGNELPPGETG